MPESTLRQRLTDWWRNLFPHHLCMPGPARPEWATHAIRFGLQCPAPPPLRWRLRMLWSREIAIVVYVWSDDSDECRQVPAVAYVSEMRNGRVVYPAQAPWSGGARTLTTDENGRPASIIRPLLVSE